MVEAQGTEGSPDVGSRYRFEHLKLGLMMKTSTLEKMIPGQATAHQTSTSRLWAEAASGPPISARPVRCS